MNMLYRTLFLALNRQGDEVVRKARFFSDPQKCKDYLIQATENGFNDTLNEFLHPDNINIYLHLTIFQEIDEEFKHLESGIISSSCYDDEKKERKTTFNTEQSLFQSL